MLITHFLLSFVKKKSNFLFKAKITQFNHYKNKNSKQNFVLGEKENANPKETKSKSRTDLSAMIAEQLMTPLHDFVPQKVIPTEPVEVKPSSDAATTDTHQDTEVAVCCTLISSSY